jgi:hypothetical protein
MFSVCTTVVVVGATSGICEAHRSCRQTACNAAPRQSAVLLVGSWWEGVGALRLEDCSFRG